jgi:nitrogen fixation NifU-like protein
MDDLDRFVDQLQNQIFDEAKAAYGEKGFDRWRNPRFQGRMESADAHARLTGDCGDSIEIYLKFENNIVKQASYFTDGCASSSICGSFAAELSMGKDPEELTDITGEAVEKAIGRLPESDRHCAGLAAAVLQEAVSRYMINQTANSNRGNKKEIK